MKQTENTDLPSYLDTSYLDTSLETSALKSSGLNSSQQENGVAVRVIMVVLLGLTLVGATRWALNVTNANARQISTGLTRLQGHYDMQANEKSR